MTSDTKKPEWLKIKYNQSEIRAVYEMLSKLNLNTVCREAECPNMGECFKNRTATFMILGKSCTRNCRFCSIDHGKPDEVSPDEPERIADAARSLGLSHVVLTSVTRDDLPDGGASHFARCVEEIRKALPKATVEVLIPDLKLNKDALDTVIRSNPTVINHNTETVKRLYPSVRPQAIYERSLAVLAYVKEKAPGIFTKSGIMVGLGETKDEVLELFSDLRRAGCDILTVGQYLRPSEQQIEMKEYVTPETFREYSDAGYAMGFRFVASGPLVRSSYMAAKALQSGEKA